MLDKGLNELFLKNPRQLVSVKLVWEKDAGKVEIFEVKPTFVSLDSIIEDIKNEIQRGKDVLVENKNIENLLNNKASDDEIVRAYEDLTTKINNFIDSEPNKEDDNNTSKPEGGENGSEGEGDKEDSGDKNENEDNKDENGNLPNTGSPLGAGELMLVGAALATLGGVTIKKRK